MRHLLSLGLIFGAVVAWAGPTQASIFQNTHVGGVLNVYNDQSYESIFDLAGGADGSEAPDGKFGVGDVIVGWLRLDDRSIPSGAPTIPDDDLYAVFTQEVSALTKEDLFNGDGDLVSTKYDLTFKPTTVAGLTLEDLVGSLPAGLKGDAAVALYEDVGINLDSTSPGDVDSDGSLTIFDFIDRIAMGNRDLIAGFGDGVVEDLAGDDFWVGEGTVGVGGLNLFDDLTVLYGAPTNSPSVATFNIGLSVLYADNGVEYLEKVGFPGQPPGASSLHELTITDGDVSGASDKMFDFGGADVNPYFFNFTLVAGVVAITEDEDDLVAYGISDDAVVSIFPIPEPCSVLIWGLLSGLGLVCVNPRRKRAA